MFVNTAGVAGRDWRVNASKVMLELADQKRRIFSLPLKTFILPETLLSPSFWAAGCKDLREGNRVEIRMPSSDPGRHHSFALEVQRNVGATGAVMAPWPYAPPGLYDAHPHRAEPRASNPPQLEHSSAA